jgi:sugar-specific transcriptional regulator TrmB
MEDFLDKLGLKKAEKKILIALSSSERPLSMAKIAEISGIPVTTAYKVTKRLMDRGFVKAVGGRPARYTARYLIEIISMEIQEKMDDIMRIWSIFSNISNNPLLVDMMRDYLPDVIKIGEKSMPVVLEWVLSRESDLRVLIPTSISFQYRNMVERIRKGSSAIVLVDLDNKLAEELEEKENLRIRKVRNKFIFGLYNGKEAVLGIEGSKPSYIYLKNELSRLFDPLFESFLRRSIPAKIEGST